MPKFHGVKRNNKRILVNSSYCIFFLFYCNVFSFIAFYCIVLYFIVLYYILLYCFTFYCIVFYFIVLYSTLLYLIYFFSIFFQVYCFLCHRKGRRRKEKEHTCFVKI